MPPAVELLSSANAARARLTQHVARAQAREDASTNAEVKAVLRTLVAQVKKKVEREGVLLRKRQRAAKRQEREHAARAKRKQKQSLKKQKRQNDAWAKDGWMAKPGTKRRRK